MSQIPSETEAVKREPGYYWVKFHRNFEWEASLFEGISWGRCFTARRYKEPELVEIGERIIHGGE